MDGKLSGIFKAVGLTVIKQQPNQELKRRQ